MLPIQLVWNAPPECPSQAEVLVELERMARPKPGRTLEGIDAEAEIEKLGDGRYRLKLMTTRGDQHGETELSSGSCSPLKRAATLVLALAFGDGVDVADESESAPAPSEPPPPPPPKAPPPVLPRRPEPPPPQEPPSYRVAPFIGAATAWRFVAEPAFATQLGVSVGRARWEVTADAAFWPPVSAARQQGIEATLLSATAALGACARVPVSSWSLGACAAAQAGVVHASSSGALKDGAATAPWFALRPSAVVSVPLSSAVGLRLEAGLELAPNPPHFAIRYLQDIYSLPSLVPTAAASISF